MARIRDADPSVASPFVLGDIISDGDGDAQAVVWEDGSPTLVGSTVAQIEAFQHSS